MNNLVLNKKNNFTNNNRICIKKLLPLAVEYIHQNTLKRIYNHLALSNFKAVVHFANRSKEKTIYRIDQ